MISYMFYYLQCVLRQLRRLHSAKGKKPAATFHPQPLNSSANIFQPNHRGPKSLPPAHHT